MVLFWIFVKFYMVKHLFDYGLYQLFPTSNMADKRHSAFSFLLISHFFTLFWILVMSEIFSFNYDS